MTQKRIKGCTYVVPEKTKPLAGALSAPLKRLKNIHYIGPLSRLTKQTEPAVKSYDLLVLLSGPEPQRSIFEEKIRNRDVAQRRNLFYRAAENLFVFIGSGKNQLNVIAGDVLYSQQVSDTECAHVRLIS